jgi:hypothetical protein
MLIVDAIKSLAERILSASSNADSGILLLFATSTSIKKFALGALPMTV